MTTLQDCQARDAADPLRPLRDPLNTQTCALEACIATPNGPLRVISLRKANKHEVRDYANQI